MADNSMYERLGGEEAISKVVDNFYGRVLEDPIINGFFKGTDMDAQRRHQVNFISYALGKRGGYSGRSMEKAHEGLNLQPEHFDAVVGHLRDSLAFFEIKEKDINDILVRVNSLKDDVLYK